MSKGQYSAPQTEAPRSGWKHEMGACIELCRSSHERTAKELSCALRAGKHDLLGRRRTLRTSAWFARDRDDVLSRLDDLLRLCGVDPCLGLDLHHKPNPKSIRPYGNREGQSVTIGKVCAHARTNFFPRDVSLGRICFGRRIIFAANFTGQAMSRISVTRSARKRIAISSRVSSATRRSGGGRGTL